MPQTPEEIALERIRQAAESGAESLDLSKLGLTALPDKLWELKHLTSLSLYNNRLTSLPPESMGLTQLTQLFLFSNELTSLPAEIGQLTNLVELDLSDNPLVNIPPAIGSLTNLVQLILFGNLLINLPSEIGRLIKLTRLVLSNNQLTTLPPEFSQLTNLEELDLSSNQLTSLPPEFSQLTNLEELDLSNNQLTKFPPEIAHLSCLIRLDLRNNKLADLPQEIGQLRKLTQLSLRTNKLSRLPPEIGNLTNLKQLYLSSNQLTNLPPEIGELINLTQLSLSSNQLTSLPPEIVQLTNLVQLSLSINQLTDIPQEITQLTNLKQLSLSNNRLTSLPAEIGHLTNLTQLILQECELITLPAEIKHLTSLKSLSLYKNELIRLPPEIGLLTNLTQLSLYNNELKQLPPEIGLLTNLTQLSLSENQLTSLPSEISQLTHLTELSLYSNKLMSLPPEIFNLNHLEKLDLTNNQLVNLPVGIENLVDLTQLYLRINRLTSLPPEIGQLINLKVLSISSNQLTDLPPEIGQLISLTQFDISHNKLTSLPTELIGLRKVEQIKLRENPLEITIPAKWLGDKYNFSKNAQDIFEYYKQLHAEGGRPLREARILVMGEADAGKTKLLRALLKGEYGARFIETRDPTEGIEVNALETEGLRLRFWDFGGQEILHATHRFFLSRRCVYLLVADSTRDREYNEAKIEYWLELIKFYGGDSPVILVASKTESFSLNVNERRLQEKYPNLVPMPALQTSAKTGRGMEDLRRALLNEAQALPSVSVMLPRSFLAVKDALEAWKAKEKVKVIEDAVYRCLCEENGITEEERQNTLLGLMHDMGVVLHYEDDRLSDFGILNPDWATGGVYKVVNNCQIRDAHGKFTLAQLKGILDDKELYPPAMRRRIVDLMKKFELTYELPLARDTYILPSALPVNQPELDGWDVPAMTFEYRYPILQVSVLHRFMVIAHTSILDDQVWYSGVVLANGENQALVRADFRDRKITTKVKGAEGTRKEFLYYLRTQFEHIHGEEAQPEEYIYSPQYPDLPLPFTDMKTLAKSEREYKVVYKGKAVSINLRELLDGFVTPEERRKDEEREKQESVRMGVDIELQEREPMKERRGGDTYVTNNVTIHGSVEGGNVAVGEKHQITQNVQGSFNGFPAELQSALLELIQKVDEVLQVAEESEDKEELKDELESLQDEAKKSKPKKERIKITVEGLKKAAENIKDVGVPVLTVAAKVIALLNSLP